MNDQVEQRHEVNEVRNEILFAIELEMLFVRCTDLTMSITVKGVWGYCVENFV